MSMSNVLLDRALLVAVCEELVPFMNGSAMGRLTFLLVELASDPSGEHLDATDRRWLEDGLCAAASRRDGWEAELTRLSAVGINAIASLDPRYPTNLTLVHDGPPVLFVRGTLCDQDRRAVAVVGTREASSEGLTLAQGIAKGLVAQGYTVVSGLAKGIDAAAHAATLNAGGAQSRCSARRLRRSIPRPTARSPIASLPPEPVCRSSFPGCIQAGGRFPLATSPVPGYRWPP